MPWRMTKSSMSTTKLGALLGEVLADLAEQAAEVLAGEGEELLDAPVEGIVEEGDGGLLELGVGDEFGEEAPDRVVNVGEGAADVEGEVVDDEGEAVFAAVAAVAPADGGGVEVGDDAVLLEPVGAEFDVAEEVGELGGDFLARISSSWSPAGVGAAVLDGAGEGVEEEGAALVVRDGVGGAGEAFAVALEGLAGAAGEDALDDVAEVGAGLGDEEDAAGGGLGDAGLEPADEMALARACLAEDGDEDEVAAGVEEVLEEALLGVGLARGVGGEGPALHGEGECVARKTGSGVVRASVLMTVPTASGSQQRNARRWGASGMEAGDVGEAVGPGGVREDGDGGVGEGVEPDGPLVVEAEPGEGGGAGEVVGGAVGGSSSR